MNQNEICSCEENKRSSDLVFSDEKEEPLQKKRLSDLSEKQLEKIYEVEEVFWDTPDPLFEDADYNEKTRANFHTRCKICECLMLASKLYPRFTDNSDFWQKHARKHIEAGFIDHEGNRLRNEVFVAEGHERVCEYCLCGIKRCGSGSYFTYRPICIFCHERGKHLPEDCPSIGDRRPPSPCCSPRKED